MFVKYYISFYHSEEDEIAALKRKLEETQRAMEKIMAQVNKVSTEIKDPVELKSSNNTGTIYEENLISSLEISNASNDETSKNRTSRDIRSENISDDTFVEGKINEPREMFVPTCEAEFENISENHEKSVDELEGTNISGRKEELNKEVYCDDFDDQTIDTNEYSESDSGIQQHYETTADFIALQQQHMYQEDETGYSYYYEDVEYDEDENDSDDESDEELEEYNHPVQAMADPSFYAHNDEYLKNFVENTFNCDENNAGIVTSSISNQESDLPMERAAEIQTELNESPSSNPESEHSIAECKENEQELIAARVRFCYLA